MATSVLAASKCVTNAQLDSLTTASILSVNRVVLENLVTKLLSPLNRQHATIVQPGDIPKQLALARKVCVFNAILANIPTKLAIQIHRNAKNVVPDSFQMNPVWTTVQIVPPPKHLNLVQRFVPNVTRDNSCPPTKSVRRVV